MASWDVVGGAGVEDPGGHDGLVYTVDSKPAIETAKLRPKKQFMTGVDARSFRILHLEIPRYLKKPQCTHSGNFNSTCLVDGLVVNKCLSWPACSTIFVCNAFRLAYSSW